jgi:hypothetical protein
MVKYIYASYPDLESAIFILHFSSLGKIDKPRAGYLDINEAKKIYGNKGSILKITVKENSDEDNMKDKTENLVVFYQDDIIDCELYVE